MADSIPTFQAQGPASNCVINGKYLGWLSCTAYAKAMGIDQATLGEETPSGCSVRRKTGDTTGGLTLTQVDNAALAWGVRSERHVGDNYAHAQEIANALHDKRGVTMQGNMLPVSKTTFRSTYGAVNHAIHLCFGRDWRKNAAGVLVPGSVWVFDPAADNRKAAWGRADEGPSFWPWDLVLQFGGSLRPWGDDDRRTLGKGRAYASFLPSTKAPFLPKYGGVATKPFPDRTTTSAPPGRRVNVRSRPDRLTSSDIVARYASGTLFRAYQKVTDGARPAGSTSRTWYGDQYGRRWIHESGLTGEGGTA